MFKVNTKNTRTDVIDVVLLFLLLTLNTSHTFFQCFYVDLEQVNINWVFPSLIHRNKYLAKYSQKAAMRSFIHLVRTQNFLKNLTYLKKILNLQLQKIYHKMYGCTIKQKLRLAKQTNLILQDHFGKTGGPGQFIHSIAKNYLH